MLKDIRAQGSIIAFFMGAMIAVGIFLMVTLPVIDQLMNNTALISSPNSVSSIPTETISTITPIPIPTPIENVGDPAKTTSLNFHAEKTRVAVGEDILIKLSAVNLITQKTMHMQVIILPPSGIGVSSSEFVLSGAGQYTSNYRIEPGEGRDIEIRMTPNEAGNFNINGRAVYYFGDEIQNSEDKSMSIPIQVISDGVGVVTTSTIGTASPQENPKSNVNVLISLMPLMLVLAFLIVLFVLTIHD